MCLGNCVLADFQFQVPPTRRACKSSAVSVHIRSGSQSPHQLLMNISLGTSRLSRHNLFHASQLSQAVQQRLQVCRAQLFYLLRCEWGPTACCRYLRCLLETFRLTDIHHVRSRKYSLGGHPCNMQSFLQSSLEHVPQAL